MTCLRQVKGLIFLAKPAYRQAGRRGAKELLRLVNLSRKMGKVGFLCGLAPLRD